MPGRRLLTFEYILIDGINSSRADAEKLARNIIYPEGHTRASFSQERMQYLEQEGKVIYTAKNRKINKSFPVLEWLAATRDL
jgi:hypothetical protein